MSDSSIAIVTDSTADLPENILEQYQIEVVNNYLIIDGKCYEDRKDISREEFYRRLPLMSSFPSTASASSGLYEKMYDQLLSRGKKFVLSIHASSKLSGIWNAASVAAQSFAGKVHVIDSLNVSLGLGFQVLAAAEAATLGKTVEQITALLTDLRLRVRLIAILDTLEYVYKGGRVSWTRARLGQLLQLKPFIEIAGGQVLSLGETRTFRKGVKRLLEMLHGLGPLERLAILHTNAEEEARALLSEIGELAPIQTLVVNVTSVIGSHAGPHALGFAAILEKP